VALLVLKTA